LFAEKSPTLFETLIVLGVVCIIGAIVGGGFEALGVRLPLLDSRVRQALLSLVGIALVGVALLARLPDEGKPSRPASTPPGHTSTGTRPPKGTPTTPPKRPPKPSPKRLWSGAVSLEVNRAYALDGFPIKSLDSCFGCLMVADYPGLGLALQAEHGVQAWKKAGHPSYADCLRLLDSGTAPAASLQVTGYQTGVPVGGWLCAFSKSNEVLRLKFAEATADGNTYGFAVTAWKPGRSS
jgi:hypothetical protein